MRIDLPLSEDLARELDEFWVEVFGGPVDISREELLGGELEHNAGHLYIERRNGEPAGTTCLTVPTRLPVLAGLGEVATAPRFRRSGIATRLCAQAVEDFRAGAGEALFLGTGNPEAARVYRRLGWTKLTGADVMANITGSDSPEEFLVDYFRGASDPVVKPANPELHIPMIPLILTPHDWQVLDANVGIFSTRYKLQGSCMSLYPRYSAVAADGRGAWFGATASDGRTVGLSTARLDESGGCRVDGFTHKAYLDVWAALVQAALEWAIPRTAGPCWAAVSVEDEEKTALFETLGFHNAGPSGEFDLADRTVSSARMELR